MDNEIRRIHHLTADESRLLMGYRLLREQTQDAMRLMIENLIRDMAAHEGDNVVKLSDFQHKP